KEMYIISCHTKKIFANMRRIGAGFSREITPLFDTMMKKHKPRRKQRNQAEVSHDESEAEDDVPTPYSDPLPSGEDSYTLNKLMVFYTSLQEQVIDLQVGKDAQSKEINALKKKVSKLLKWKNSRSRGLRRLKKIGSGRSVKSDVSTAEPVTTAGEVVTIDADKSTKPKVVVQEKEVSTKILAAATTVTTIVPTLRAKGIVFHKQKQSHIPTVSSSKDKGKGKMTEPEVPIKKKDQMRMDEEYVKQLEAKEQEAARLSRAQQDKEANISYDNTQAM
nr:hypothetical protein [Tanacetum cinerariifolium]